MPNEPERPIEKLLRGAARKRRDRAGAPFEVHPVTRRLLQGEVAREFPKHAVPAPRSFLATFWPRFALTALGLLVISIGIISVLPPGLGKKQEQLLAQNKVHVTKSPAMVSSNPEPRKDQPRPTEIPFEPQILAEQSVPPAVPAKPTVAPPYSAISKDSDKEIVVIRPSASRVAAPAATTDLADSSTALAPTSITPAAPAPSPNYGLAGTPARAEGSTEQDYRRAIAPQGPAQVADSIGTLISGGSEPGAVTQSQNFAGVQAKEAKPGGQAFVRSRLANPMPLESGPTFSGAEGVMISFKLEQAGQEVRVVDGDGSVYSGPLQSTSSQELYRNRVALSDSSAVASASAEKAATPGYYFQLTGTNRTLNKKVVFTGTLLPTNTVLGISNVDPNAANPVLRTQPQSGTLPLPISRLSGRLLVGDGASIEINAVPAKP